MSPSPQDSCPSYCGAETFRLVPIRDVSVCSKSVYRRAPWPHGKVKRLRGVGTPSKNSRLWKAKSSRETCHLRLPLAASTEAAWACSASIRLISRRMRTRLIRILSGPLLIRLAGLAVKGVCGRAISVPFPYAGQVTRRCRLIKARTLRADMGACCNHCPNGQDLYES
jgi:hypothetical protein